MKILRVCWRQDAAPIVLGRPTRTVDDIENYAAQILIVVDKKQTRSFHHSQFRKSSNAKSIYFKCYTLRSVELDIDPVRCVHPNCRRTKQPTPFEWPEEYYEV